MVIGVKGALKHHAIAGGSLQSFRRH